MRDKRLFQTTRIIGFVVLLLMAVALVYGAYISITYYPGIGV